MANFELEQVTLALKFEVGTNDNDDPIYKTSAYRNIQTTVTAEQVAAFAGAIASLTTYPLADISKTDKQRVATL
ncbi:DUF1659 domain-containing protein [Solibacillus sp. CAU 1738]|uniref:DUF1659 domain-containing protein n=1 Tax=Solibacillus sp. CAU 1738 TaxID=3140363 RepID=UPI003261693F